MNFKNLSPTGKCSVCSINTWAETNNEPAIWPCGVPNCPYPHKPQKPIEHSSTGSSLELTFYEGN